MQSEKLMQTNIITEKLKQQFETQKQSEQSPKRKKSRGQDMAEEIKTRRENEERRKENEERRRREEKEEESGEEEMEEGEMPELEEITEDEAILDMHLHREDSAADASLYNITIATQNQSLTSQKPKQIKELFQQGKIKYLRSNNTKISNRIIEELILANKMSCKTNNIIHVNKAKYKELKNGTTIDPNG